MRYAEKQKALKIELARQAGELKQANGKGGPSKDGKGHEIETGEQKQAAGSDQASKVRKERKEGPRRQSHEFNSQSSKRLNQNEISTSKPTLLYLANVAHKASDPKEASNPKKSRPKKQPDLGAAISKLPSIMQDEGSEFEFARTGKRGEKRGGEPGEPRKGKGRPRKEAKSPRKETEKKKKGKKPSIRGKEDPNSEKTQIGEANEPDLGLALEKGKETTPQAPQASSY